MAATGGPLGGYRMSKPGTITAFTVTDFPHEKESDDNDRTEVSGKLVLACRVIFSVKMDSGENKWFYSDQVKEIIDNPSPSA